MSDSQLMKKKAKAAESLKKYYLYLLLIVVGVTMLAPFLWMISTSLKGRGAVFSSKIEWIPRPVLWRNYIEAWNSVPFGKFFINSITVSLFVTIGQLLTASLAAYSFARLQWKGRDKIFFAYLATMMIPGIVTLIPVYIIIKNLQWIDTLKALIVPAMFTAYGTFMLRQFFLSIPKELEEAAVIDGCSKLRIYWTIILPLSKPALATLGTFTFMGTWNDFMWPLIVMKTLDKKTLPVGLAAFQGLYGTDWPLLMAASVIVLLPIIFLYIFNQRFFVKGIAMTGLKD